MKNYKNIYIAFLLIIFLSSCGYTPIFSKKSVNFSLEEIELLGDKEINQNINYALSSFKNRPDKEKKISLILNSYKTKKITSKDSKGNAKLYKILVQVKIKIFLNENGFPEKSIENTATYKASNSKSEERSIEKKLISDLSNQIAQKIILELLTKTN